MVSFFFFLAVWRARRIGSCDRSRRTASHRCPAAPPRRYLGHFCNDGARLANDDEDDDDEDDDHEGGGDGDGRERGADDEEGGDEHRDAGARRAGAQSYSRASSLARNAQHTDVEGLHMVTVATRAIRCGEEVLVTYGEDYWREHHERRRWALPARAEAREADATRASSPESLECK